jgi:hypothetical protein
MKRAARLSALSMLPAVFVILAAALVSLPAPLLAQEASVAPVAAASKPTSALTSALTAEQVEQFLLNATIVSSRKIGKGVTGSRVATLSDGRLTHDAHIQDVNIERHADRNFKDQYRYNIAAYRLARLLGIANVPASVERRVDDIPAAVTWWIDDVLMDEEKRLTLEKNKTAPPWPRVRTLGYIQVMRVFDQLIANADRNAGNLLWTIDGRLWLIDHTRAFRLQRALKEAATSGALRSRAVERLATADDRVGDRRRRSHAHEGRNQSPDRSARSHRQTVRRHDRDPRRRDDPLRSDAVAYCGRSKSG